MGDDIQMLLRRGSEVPIGFEKKNSRAIQGLVHFIERFGSL